MKSWLDLWEKVQKKKKKNKNKNKANHFAPLRLRTITTNLLDLYRSYMMDFLNKVGSESVLDSLTLNSWTTEDLALFVGSNASVWGKKAIDVQWLAVLPNVKTLSYARNYPLLATINIGLTRNGSVCILPMICRSEEQIKEYVHQKRINVAVTWVLPLPGNDYSVSSGTLKR